MYKRALMPCAVSIDLSRHERQVDADESRLDWLHGEATQLASEWRDQLSTQLIIVDLAAEYGDLKLQAKEENKTIDKCIYDLAYQWVVDREDEFLQKSLGWN